MKTKQSFFLPFICDSWTFALQESYVSEKAIEQKWQRPWKKYFKFLIDFFTDLYENIFENPDEMDHFSKKIQFTKVGKLKT